MGTSKQPLLFLLTCSLLFSCISGLGGASQSSESEAESVSFTDVANLTGLAQLNPGPLTDWAAYGPGTAWGDYDRDGDLDLYITARFDHLGLEIEKRFNESATDLEINTAVGENDSGQTYLMRNDGDRFTDVSVAAGVKLSDSTAIGASWADYDGDGDVDLYISNYGVANFSNSDDVLGEPNIMFANNGDGTFTDVTPLSNLGNPGHSTGGIWADYDHDGDLDLYALNAGMIAEEDYDVQAETNILYRNDGDSNGDGVPEFSDQTIEAGRISGQDLNPVEDFVPMATDKVSMGSGGGGSMAPPSGTGEGELTLSPGGTGVSWAGLWFDYNRDGWQDLFVASDFGISPLYENDGGGTFTLATVSAGLDQKGTGMGAHAADIDGDGDFDLCQTNFGPNYIWYNENGESFEKVLDSETHNQDDKRITVNWDCHFFDYDLDGDLDYFTTAGRINWFVPTQENTLFRNDGSGRFTDVTSEVGLAGHLKSMGASVVDYDLDGDVDILIGNSDAPLQLFENNAAQVTQNHWLRVAMRGNQSNTHGIGQLVEVELANGTVISQQSFAGSGYLGSGDPTLHFGLGTSEVIEVRVHWSTGHIQTIQNPPLDTTLFVDEEPPPATDNQMVLIGIVATAAIAVALLLYVKMIWKPSWPADANPTDAEPAPENTK